MVEHGDDVSESANLNSKQVIQHSSRPNPNLSTATSACLTVAKSTWPAHHPIPKAFAGTSNEGCSSTHSVLPHDQNWNIAVFLTWKLSQVMALKFPRWLLPAQLQNLSTHMLECLALTSPITTTAPTLFTVLIIFSSLAQLLTLVLHQSLFSFQRGFSTSALSNKNCNLKASYKDSKAPTTSGLSWQTFTKPKQGHLAPNSWNQTWSDCNSIWNLM